MKVLSRLLLLAPFLPVFVFAAVGEFADAKKLVGGLTTFMNDALIPAIFALGFLVFIWGMFKAFILGGNNEEAQGEGKQLILYAVIGFVVMISLWGIVTLFATGLGLDDKQITPPSFKVDTGQKTSNPLPPAPRQPSI